MINEVIARQRVHYAKPGANVQLLRIRDHFKVIELDIPLTRAVCHCYTLYNLPFRWVFERSRITRMLKQVYNNTYVLPITRI